MNQEEWKKKSHSFYNSKEWKQVREYCLLRDHYLCVNCGKPASDVHHKIELINGLYDKKVNLNPDNLISLCKQCHTIHHKRDVMLFDEDGMPMPPYKK